MNASLFWAIVWAIVLVLSIVAIFWNPSHFITLGFSAFFTGAFIRDYIKTRPFKK